MINNILIVIICILCMTVSYAQDSTNTDSNNINREIGATATGLDDINVIYKKQIGENKWRRHRFLIGSIALSSNSDFRLDIGYAFGTEKRKQFTDKVFLFHGWEPRISAFYQNIFDNSSQQRLTTSAALGYMLGMQIYLSDKLYVSGEIVPSAQLTYSTINDFVSFETGFNSNSVLFAVVYKI